MDKRNIALLLVVSIIMFFACKKTEKIIERNYNGLPTSNPYDEIEYDDSLIQSITLDSFSIAGLHSYIFKVKCAEPACHDGSFAPDFRSIQSTYNTLVYQEVTKKLAPWEYRVVPGDTAASWFWQRINHELIISDGDTSQGRMPLYSPKLSNSELNNIKKWILEGASDLFGHAPSLPDLQPSFFGLYAESNGIRLDTNRMDNVSFLPFVVPQNTNVNIWFGLFDTDENGDFLGAGDFSYNKIKFATRPTFISSSQEQSLILDSSPSWFPSLYGINLPYYHHITVNTSNYNIGDIIYMQLYINDNQHTGNIEIPGLGSQTYFLTYFSFTVQ
jgi:hypothetical protein